MKNTYREAEDEVNLWNRVVSIFIFLSVLMLLLILLYGLEIWMIKD